MFPIQSARRNIGFVALALAFIFLFSTALQIMIAAVVTLAGGAKLFDNIVFSWAVGSLPMYFVAMPLSILFFKQCDKTIEPTPKKLTPWCFFLVLSASFVGSYAFSILGNIVNRIFSAMLGREAINEIEELTVSAPIWANILFLVILSPIFEEIFFRKLVIDRLLPYGELPAVILSGVTFGLIHGNFNQFFYAVAIGMIFGLVYLRTGNILYSIGMHMILNLIGGVYASEVLKLLDAGSSVGVVLNAIYFVLLGAAFVVALINAKKPFLQHVCHFVPAEPSATAREWVSVLACNPSVWVFLAVVALMFVL